MGMPQTWTALYRPSRSYPIDRQREAVCTWVAAHGGSIAQEYTTTEYANARDEWINRARSTEGAIVAALWLIAEPRGSVRPTTDQARALVRLERAAALIVEAETGITSRSPEWSDRKVEAQDFIASGKRKLSQRKARAMALKSREKAGPGIVERWRDRANKRKFEQWQKHWTSRMFASGVKAYNALPAAVRDDIGSYRMMYAIFGPRRPGDKRAGGRPRKSK